MSSKYVPAWGLPPALIVKATLSGGGACADRLCCDGTSELSFCGKAERPFVRGLGGGSAVGDVERPGEAVSDGLLPAVGVPAVGVPAVGVPAVGVPAEGVSGDFVTVVGVTAVGELAVLGDALLDPSVDVAEDGLGVSAFAAADSSSNAAATPAVAQWAMFLRRIF